MLNIWKPDLSEKLRPAAQAAWRGQQLCWALAEGGLLGSPDNGQGGRGRKGVEKQGREVVGGRGGGRSLETYYSGCSTNQQYQHLPGTETCWKCRVSGLTLDLLNLNLHPNKFPQVIFKQINI